MEEEVKFHRSMSDLIFFAGLNRARLFPVTVDGMKGFAFHDMKGRLHCRVCGMAVYLR